MVKFEDKIGEIDLILTQKRGFWNLESISHVSYEDICQEIRIHILKKFSQWRQEEPFRRWAAQVINNQLINLRVKYYGKFCPPCRGCEFNQGGESCALTENGIKCEECADFANWKKKKEQAYRLLLAESIDKGYDDDPEGEGRIKIESAASPDYFSAQERLHSLMLDGLDDRMARIYKWIYIETRTDEFVAAQMGFKGKPAGKRIRYRQIENIKKNFAVRAKDIVSRIDIFEDE